jgi:hypothetical protein
MKRMKYLISTGLLLIAFVAFGQKEDQVKKSFNVGGAGSLSIANSFGDVNITPYSGSVIDMEITITLETKNTSDYQKYRDMIRIEAKEEGNNVSVRTINEMKGGNKVTKFSIDYEVKVPARTNINVKLTFGELKIDGSDGVLDLNVQHGDCYVGKAPANGHEISIQFGDLRIDEIGSAELDIQHGDLDVDRLTLNELEIQFGDAKIETLAGTGEIDIQHGDMRIENLATDMGDLEVEIQFGDLRIGGVSDGNFEIDMSGSFTDFSWDGSYNISERKKEINSESYMMETTSGSGTKSRLRIEASHSDVDLD